jgi:hypothetical protein
MAAVFLLPKEALAFGYACLAVGFKLILLALLVRVKRLLALGLVVLVLV